MLTKRRIKNRVWTLWRGSFLRYGSLDEPDSIDYRDWWACQRVEAMGLDPTVKPGKTEYLRLCHANYLTLRKFIDMTTNYRLFWAPPLSSYDPDLATILNALTETHATPEDAGARMASHTEQCELVAEQRGLKLIRCNVPSSNMLACLERIGGINDENIRRCLQVYANNFPGELTVD